MPILSSSYYPPFFFNNPHLQTIYPTLFRVLPQIAYIREKLELPDGDFLDLDWVKNNSRRLAILSHGMEGSSNGVYIRGMARALISEGWDIIAWNFRGCGGSPNRLPRFYHSGASEDLASVINYALIFPQYSNISLIGFSMGGNITLKYLGETSNSLSSRIKSAVAISVPCDLLGAALSLGEPKNIVYMKRFLYFLKRKIKEKSQRFPSLYSLNGYSKIKDFITFDNRYTAPIHGFKSAEEYYQRSSSINYISSIKIPTLILNALDDPFLGTKSSLIEICNKSQNVSLETPCHGGHVGFISFKGDRYWSESRTLQVLNTL